MTVSRCLEGHHIRARHLIWVDCIAGAVVGMLVLSVHRWLAALYSLPATLVLVMGCANLLYASGSFSLAMASRGDHVPYLRVVAAANMLWAVGCLVMTAVWFGHASLYGVVQLIGEAVFVGGLGVLEWQAASRMSADTPDTNQTHTMV